MTETARLGTLEWAPALSSLELVAAPVAQLLQSWEHRDAAESVLAAPIDDSLADTAAFCAAYQVGLEQSANCVVVAGKRGETVRMAACMVLATTRLDVNGIVRRFLDARRASFAPMEEAVAQTGMEYGGITPLGVPAQWPILIDPAVVAAGWVVVGSGLRRSKLSLSGEALAQLPNAQLIDGLANPIE